MQPRIGRHFGLDWLRIAAFALLIFYHIGMYFAPGEWIVKAPRPVVSAAWPMLFVQPWRLVLLFVVSGYASRALLGKLGSPQAFARSRSLRLLVPLGFAMIAIIPVQSWIGLVGNHGYGQGFLHFLAYDWFGFRTVDGVGLPATEHLWFVHYLWVYSMLLAAALAWLSPAARARCAGWFEKLAEGRRLLWLPIAAIVVLRLSILFVVPEEGGVLRDWHGHIVYVPAFLFGFGLAGTPGLWPAVRRLRRPALALAAAAYLILLAVEIAHPVATPGHVVQALRRSAAIVMGWAAILPLLALADRFLNHDHRWRATLAEAVFPFYIVHQTIIVLVGWELRDRGLGNGLQFLILAGMTLAGCVAFFECGRRIRWLRPLIGLSRAPKEEPRQPVLA